MDKKMNFSGNAILFFIGLLIVVFFGIKIEVNHTGKQEMVHSMDQWSTLKIKHDGGIGQHSGY